MLVHEEGYFWAYRWAGCWTPQPSSDLQCSRTTPIGVVQGYVEVENGDSIQVRIMPESRPANLQATFVTQLGEIMVGDVVHLSPDERQFEVDMPPGTYNVRLHMQWYEGGPHLHHEASYVFGITIPGETELRSSCTSTLIGGIQGIVLDSLDDRARTKPDPYNGTGCRFNREITRVVLTLESDDRRYVETFRLEPPSLTLSLPLSENIASESTGGPLPPGLYTREIVAFAADGDGDGKELLPRELEVVKLSDGPADPDAPATFLHHHEPPRIYATTSPEYLRGQLEVQGGCIYIRNGDIPVWPSGFSMREREGRVEVLNHRGHVVDQRNVTLKGRREEVMGPLGRELTGQMPLHCPPGNFWIVDAEEVLDSRNLLPDTQPSPDWTPAEVSVGDSSEGFSIMLPPEWELRNLEGIDSLVGELVGDGIRLVYDYGDFSLTLVPDVFDPDRQYTVAKESIGGLEAMIVVPTFGSAGLTSIYFDSIGGKRLSLSAEDLTLEQQLVAVAVFRSIRDLNR